jgi:hypothetical protein
MNEQDPELHRQGPPHVAFSEADLGYLILIQENLENPLLPHEDRQLRLIDVQAKHHRQLQESGLLWRAVIAASEYDVKHEDVKPMPEIPYQVRIFRRQARLPDKQIVEATGIRFVTSEQDSSGNYSPTNYDVCIALGKQAYPPFVEEEAELILRQVEELAALQAELHLSDDLTMVRLPADT